LAPILLPKKDMLFDPLYLSHDFSLIIWLCFALLAQSTPPKTGRIARTNIPKQFGIDRAYRVVEPGHVAEQTAGLVSMAPADAAELWVAGDRFSASSGVPEHEANGAVAGLSGTPFIAVQAKELRKYPCHGLCAPCRLAGW
jgi:hypothetical protein